MEDYLTSGDPRRRNRILLIASVVLLLAWLLWAAHGALLPYILALVMGYLMLPFVNSLDRLLRRAIRRPGVARGLAIVAVYLVCAAVVALFISMLVPVLSQQFNALWDMRFDMATQINDLAQRGLSWYYEHVPLDLQQQVEANLRAIGNTLTTAAQLGITRTFTFVTGTVSFILGFAVIPFWLFYVLYDQERIRKSMKNMVPARYQADVRNVFHLVDTVMGAYIRGQLLLALAIGLMAGVGLSLLHVPFPAVLGLVAALFELLPFIGPILGAIPAVLVALIQSPVLVLWTILLFLGIQQIENYVLAPRISGQAVQLHPAAIMVVLVVGNEVAGLWGMLIAVPVTAIVRDVFRYLYLRFQDEPCEPADAMARMGRK